MKPSHSVAAISNRNFPAPRGARRVMAVMRASLSNPVGVSWALGTAVAGWIPAALAFRAVDRAAQEALGGAAAFLVWLFTVVVGLMLGTVLGGRASAAQRPHPAPAPSEQAQLDGSPRRD